MIKESYFTGTLLPHQVEALKKLDETDAMLVYHGLGSGKSATSIAGSEGLKADVIVPASLRENYKKEIKKFTKNPSERNVISYNKFTKDGPSYDSDTMVMDEVQRIGRSESQASRNAVDAAKFYKKRILLSGTPALNHPRELAPVIRLLSPESKNIPLDPTLFNKKFIGEEKIPVSFFQSLRGIKPGVKLKPINVDEIKDAVLGKVHYHETQKEDFPERIDEIREVEASDEQNKIYKYVTSKANPVLAMKVRMNLPLSKKELKSINSFMTAARQVSNTTKPYGGKERFSNKVKEVVNDIFDMSKKNTKHKSLVYSNYIQSGLDEIESGLLDKGVSFARFTGKMNDRAKKEAVDDYNSGKVNALLVSSSGSEGIDLKGTRAIHIVEPHWNDNRIEQVIGRGIRYKSHSDLPEKERKVKVIKYHTTLPKTTMQKIFKKDPDISSDKYLHELSKEKKNLLDQYLSILKEEGVKKMHKKLPDTKKMENSRGEPLQKVSFPLNINIGDYLLGGRFKNQRQKVKSLGTDELGQPTYNKGKKLLAVRIEKVMPPDKKSGKTKRERKEMEKQALLEEVYNESFNDELEKIAKEIGLTDSAISRFKEVTVPGYIGAIKGALVGGAGGAAVGTALAAALRKDKKIGAMFGLAGGMGLGSIGGSIHGQTVGSQKFIKKHTGNDVSKTRAFASDIIDVGLPAAIGGTLGEGAGKLITRGPGGSFLGRMAGSAAGYALGSRNVASSKGLISTKKNKS